MQDVLGDLGAIVYGEELGMRKGRSSGVRMWRCSFVGERKSMMDGF